MTFDKKLYQARRKQLLDLLPDTLILLEGHTLVTRNHDAEFPFRQSSSFSYMTGFHEPDAILALWREDGKDRSIAFVPPRDELMELWHGKRLGVDAAPDTLGVERALSYDEWRKELPKLVEGFQKIAFNQFKTTDFTSAIRKICGDLYHRGKTKKLPPSELIHVEKHIHHMRMFKSEEEIATMRRALEITTEAHKAAMALTAPGKYEYEIQAVMEYIYTKNHCPPAYNNILGSGANACCLHYIENNRQMKDGDLLLIDSGAEYNLYASDITRTFPVNGKYSPEQKDLYEVVLNAQIEAIKACKLGSTPADIHQVATKHLMQGLIDLKIVSKSLDELLDGDNARRYYPHGTGHWLGMDVHDQNPYFVANDKTAPLEANQVFTIEPGIYFQSYHTEIDERWRGLGIRIEDDILMTDNGPVNLSAAIPKTVEEVEQACAQSIADFNLF